MLIKEEADMVFLAIAESINSRLHGKPENLSAQADNGQC